MGGLGLLSKQRQGLFRAKLQALLVGECDRGLKRGTILQAAADWQKVARLPYAQQLLASEPGQAALQRTLGMSADAMRNMLAWRVWRWSDVRPHYTKVLPFDMGKCCAGAVRGPSVWQLCRWLPFAQFLGYKK